jgi:hypothetical protein
LPKLGWIAITGIADEQMLATTYSFFCFSNKMGISQTTRPGLALNLDPPDLSLSSI